MILIGKWAKPDWSNAISERSCWETTAKTKVNTAGKHSTDRVRGRNLVFLFPHTLSFCLATQSSLQHSWYYVQHHPHSVTTSPSFITACTAARTLQPECKVCSECADLEKRTWGLITSQRGPSVIKEALITVTPSCVSCRSADWHPCQCWH